MCIRDSSNNPDNDNASEIHQKTDEGWELVSSFPSTEGSVLPVGFKPDNESIYIIDNAQFDVETLFELNPKTAERKEIYKHPTVDISSLEMDKDGNLIGIYLEPDFPLYVPIDTTSAFGQSLDHIHNTFKGYLSLIHISEPTRPY